MARKIAAVQPEVTGLILAGGAGRRVEDRDKGLLPWRGKRLVEQVHSRIQGQVGAVAISCNRNIETYRSLSSVVFTDHREDFQGPLAGLEAAHTHITTEFLLVAPCDTPLLPLDLVEQLLAPLLLDKSLEVAHARSNDRDHYLCAVLRSSCLTSLGDYLNRGGRAVRYWYAERRVLAVPVRAGDDAFLNINALPD